MHIVWGIYEEQIIKQSLRILGQLDFICIFFFVILILSAYVLIIDFRKVDRQNLYPVNEDWCIWLATSLKRMLISIAKMYNFFVSIFFWFKLIYKGSSYIYNTSIYITDLQIIFPTNPSFKSMQNFGFR